MFLFILKKGIWCNCSYFDIAFFEIHRNEYEVRRLHTALGFIVRAAHATKL